MNLYSRVLTYPKHVQSMFPKCTKHINNMSSTCCSAVPTYFKHSPNTIRMYCLHVCKIFHVPDLSPTCPKHVLIMYLSFRQHVFNTCLSCPKNVLDKSAGDSLPGDLYCDKIIPECTDSVSKTFPLPHLSIKIKDC